METPQPKPDARAFARLLALAGALGIAVALVYLGFEYSMEHARHWLWHTLPGGSPSWWQSVAIAAVGALRLGLALVRAPEFAAALTQHCADSLRRRLADDSERGRVLLAAALQQVGEGGTVVVSTLRRERLRDLQGLPAVDDDVRLLNRLFSEALAVPGTHATAS